jgi:hypothetical protein
MLALDINAAEQRRQHEAHLARHRRLWPAVRPVVIVAREVRNAIEPTLAAREEPSASDPLRDLLEMLEAEPPTIVAPAPTPHFHTSAPRDWLVISGKGGCPSIQYIMSKTAEFFGTTAVDMTSQRRDAASMRPRQIAMYLAKTLTLRSLPEIGRRFGGRDHTTILHAVRKIDGLLETDPELRSQVEKVRALIEGRFA